MLKVNWRKYEKLDKTIPQSGGVPLGHCDCAKVSMARINAGALMPQRLDEECGSDFMLSFKACSVLKNVSALVQHAVAGAQMARPSGLAYA